MTCSISWGIKNRPKQWHHVSCQLTNETSTRVKNEQWTRILLQWPRRLLDKGGNWWWTKNWTISSSSIELSRTKKGHLRLERSSRTRRVVQDQKGPPRPKGHPRPERSSKTKRVVQDQKGCPRLKGLFRTRKVIQDQKGRLGPKGSSSSRSDLDDHPTLIDFQSEFLPKAYKSDHILLF